MNTHTETKQETKFDKLDYIINEINQTINFNKFTIDAKKYKIDYYTKLKNELYKVKLSKIKLHNFQSETLKYSETLEKQSYRDKLLKCIEKLEIHNFAPELNKLVFINKEYILTSNKFTINEALDKVIKNCCISTLKNIILKNKVTL